MHIRTPSKPQMNFLVLSQISSWLACTHGTGRQWCVLHLKDTSAYPCPPSPSKPSKDNDPPVIEFHDNLAATVRIHGFYSFLYPCMDTWITPYQTSDVQQALTTSTRSISGSWMICSKPKLGLQPWPPLLHSCAPVCEPSNHSSFGTGKSRRQILRDGSWFRLVDRCHSLSVLRSLHESNSPARNWVSNQLQVYYISWRMRLLCLRAKLSC